MVVALAVALAAAVAAVVNFWLSEFQNCRLYAAAGDAGEVALAVSVAVLQFVLAVASQVLYHLYLA